MEDYSVREDRGPYLLSKHDGGLHPDKTLELIKEGCTITPTDKNYKIYIDTPHGQFKAYFYDWTDLQKSELINLINDKKVSFNYPGYFYVLPFFCVKAD